MTRYERREIERARTAKMNETVTRPSLTSAFYAGVTAVGIILVDVGMQTESALHIGAGIVFAVFGASGILSQLLHVFLFRRWLVSSTKIINEYEVEEPESNHREVVLDNGNDTFVLRRDPKPIPGTSVILTSRELLAFVDQLDSGQGDGRLLRPNWMSGTRFQNIRAAMEEGGLIVIEGVAGYVTMAGEHFIRSV